MIKRILVPLDGSALAESVLPVAAQLTRSLEGNLALQTPARKRRF